VRRSALSLFSAERPAQPRKARGPFVIGIAILTTQRKCLACGLPPPPRRHAQAFSALRNTAPLRRKSRKERRPTLALGNRRRPLLPAATHPAAAGPRVRAFLLMPLVFRFPVAFVAPLRPRCIGLSPLRGRRLVSISRLPARTPLPAAVGPHTRCRWASASALPPGLPLPACAALRRRVPLASNSWVGMGARFPVAAGLPQREPLTSTSWLSRRPAPRVSRWRWAFLPSRLFA